MPQQQIIGYGVWVLALVMFYFMMIAPQKKKQKEVKAMRESISVGDEIITIGGIHGRVKKVTESNFQLETSKGASPIIFEKWAIAEVVKSKGSSKGKDTDEKIEKLAEDTNKEEEATEE